MNYDNVKLWFAKNQDNNIITIDDINDENKNNTYLCPMCGSKLIPKAIKSKQITSHFAHVDASKCNSETMIHWWFKNKFLVQGDKFVIKSDVEKEYVCREVLVEQNYIVGDKAYRPDVTVLTECGKTIFFEMDYSNKKKVSDYIDIWLELKNIVVEVDIKKLMMKDKIPVFKALFYNGKCFNIKKNDIYYNTIGKYKEGVYQSGCSKERKEKIKKLDWFWDDVFRYKSGEVDIDYMIDLIDCIEEDEKEVVDLILNKPMCVDLYKNYIGYKTNKVYEALINKAKELFNDDYINNIQASVNYDIFYKKYFGYIDILNCRYNISNCTYDELEENLNRIKFEIESQKELKYAINNNTLKEVIENLDKKYKNIDNNYHLYDRFGCVQNINFVYNYNTKIDFRLPKEVIYSDDTNYIEKYITEKINLYLSKIVPFENKQLIQNVITDINLHYNKIFKTEKQIINKKIGRKKYKTVVDYQKYAYGVKHRCIAENCIRIELVKNNVNTGYDYSVERNKYLYIINNGIYQSYEYISDQNIEVLDYKTKLVLIGYYDSLNKLEFILKNYISNIIRNDRYKNKGD